MPVNRAGGRRKATRQESDDAALGRPRRASRPPGAGAQRAGGRTAAGSAWPRVTLPRPGRPFPGAFAVPFVNVARFRDGRMAGESIYSDLASLCDQSGLSIEKVPNHGEAFFRPRSRHQPFIDGTSAPLHNDHVQACGACGRGSVTPDWHGLSNAYRHGEGPSASGARDR